MTLALALLAVLLTVAPAAAHSFTFPVKFTDYWPNLTAMDAGWQLEGTPPFRWGWRRTGPGTFGLVGGSLFGCIEDHYVILSDDHTPGGPTDRDPRIAGGIYLTHSWADCPDGVRFSQSYVPSQHFAPTSWEPGFGTVALEQTNYKMFLMPPAGVPVEFQRTEMNAWTVTAVEPDGIHHVFFQRWFDLGSGIERGGDVEHFWFGDVPLCDAPGTTAKGLTRYRNAFGIDVRFCWRRP